MGEREKSAQRSNELVKQVSVIVSKNVTIKVDTINQSTRSIAKKVTVDHDLLSCSKHARHLARKG